ncbi:hypothetical protein BC827DRAFT_1162818 [Russula dissimulans]|nr:hypothetical protein BC827DRAFT_1162818 [Russula dissimulans]
MSPSPWEVLRNAPFFTLTFRYRSVTAFRDQTQTTEDLIKLARTTFPALESVPAGDIVVLAKLPQDPDMERVEISDRAWPLIHPLVTRVEIALRTNSET